MNTGVVDAILPSMARQRHLKVTSGKHIGISPLTFKNMKPSDEFTILAHGN